MLAGYWQADRTNGQIPALADGEGTARYKYQTPTRNRRAFNALLFNAEYGGTWDQRPALSRSAFLCGFSLRLFSAAFLCDLSGEKALTAKFAEKR
jgi:hypothetical protein